MRLHLFLFTSLLTFSAIAQNSYKYNQPEQLNDGWQTADLRTQGLDTTKLYQLFAQLPEAEHELHSILAVQGGELLLEEYFDDQQRDDQHDLRSASKSIRSLLIGIAIDQGFIGSIDDPIQKYLRPLEAKKNLDYRKEKITIRHLLTMSPGWDCNDRDKGSAGQEDRIYRKKDWLQYALDLSIINEPGAVSSYCSIGTVMLMEVLERASGMSLDGFAKKYLLDPLGISNYRWDHTSKKEVISAAKRLYMTPRDMAKIGQLVLQNGNWNGQLLVSEAWIAQSTNQHTFIGESGYGFLWWMNAFPYEGKAIPGFAASGNGGQYIVVFPEIDAVFVFTGGAYNSPKAQLPLFVIRDILIPTFGARN